MAISFSADGPMKSQVFSPVQVRAARGLLAWTQQKLARRADLTLRAVRSYEVGTLELKREELGRIARAFRAADVIPIADGRAGEGVRFAKPRAGRWLVLWRWPD